MSDQGGAAVGSRGPDTGCKVLGKSCMDLFAPSCWAPGVCFGLARLPANWLFLFPSFPQLSAVTQPVSEGSAPVTGCFALSGCFVLAASRQTPPAPLRAPDQQNQRIRSVWSRLV